MTKFFKISFTDFLFYGIFVLLLTGCNTRDSSEFESTIEAEPASVMPKDLWIADAENWTNLDLKKKEDYKLYSTYSNSDKEIEMHFDPEKKLFLVRLLNDPKFNQNLFCEEGRIVFSNHSTQNDSSQWMAAYANGKAYAAAEKAAGDWKSRGIDEVPIDFNAVNAALKTAADYQRKELKQSYHSRFLDNQERITAAFNSEISLSFSLNVRKGDKVNIDLTDDSKDVYFIVEPNNGSNMEHSSWDGIAEKTGDMAIIVYAVNAQPGKKFTLKAKATPQNQEIAQVR
ncbi:hypothetical protein G3O08_09125 [Cryomorpha ignava]|uniref:Uncharacterized protein n=1 Tax=Cryomorpha ignava TaxID=101383 RepID=A0A7K3WS31_9FLAO|nr:hypothetical protein [Cryomorpha ignava]NEN23662.1 hypothetical protein [Cryomorpha ignava]